VGNHRGSVWFGPAVGSIFQSLGQCGWKESFLNPQLDFYSASLAVLRQAADWPVRVVKSLHRLAAILQAVDAGDVRVVQRGEHLGFALEARNTIRIGGEALGQELFGNGASFVSRAR
jgi:hypothetical protein